MTSWSIVDGIGNIKIVPLVVILISQFKVRIVIVDKSRYGQKYWDKSKQRKGITLSPGFIIKHCKSFNGPNKKFISIELLSEATEALLPVIRMLELYSHKNPPKEVPRKLTSSIFSRFYSFRQLTLNIGVFNRFMGSSDCKDLTLNDAGQEIACISTKIGVSRDRYLSVGHFDPLPRPS